MPADARRVAARRNAAPAHRGGPPAGLASLPDAAAAPARDARRRGGGGRRRPEGRFWPYHRRLLASHDLEDATLLALAREEGLDANRIAAELRDGIHAEAVRADKQAGRELPLKRTPTFVAHGQPWDGFYDVETLSELIA